MIKPGLILVGIAACILLAFVLLSYTGVTRFGSCGPNAIGLILLLGFLFSGGIGLLWMLVGCVALLVDRLRGRESSEAGA